MGGSTALASRSARCREIGFHVFSLAQREVPGDWVPRCCPRAARGAVSLGSTALPSRSARCREIASFVFSLLLASFCQTQGSKTPSPGVNPVSLLSPALHHLRTIRGVCGVA